MSKPDTRALDAAAVQNPPDRAAQHATARIAGASARSEVDSFIVMDVMRAAAALEASGQRVIHMEVGQPGTPAPKLAQKALINALPDDTLGYTLALGRHELRQRIAQHYEEMYGIDVDPERVIMTTGSSGAFVLAFLALFDAGQAVGLPSPGYPCYRHILTALGGHPEIIETGPDSRWMPTTEQIGELHARSPLAGLLIASPSNPTGTMIQPDRLKQICALCDKRGITFISDEIYHGLDYTFPAMTALQASDNAIVINSFSKYFSMTGWRIGWMIVPQPLVRTIERLAQNLFISPPTPSQVAALAAFDAKEELEKNKKLYEQNRSLLLTGLPEAGFDRLVPADGAFYLYCDVSTHTDDSLAFARKMLEQTSVAVTPGLDFDARRGHHYIRFSYSGPTADMAECIERLRTWMQNRDNT